MNRIADLSKKKGLSQQALANDLFVNQTAVSQWERGKTYPSGEMLLKLCDLFQVTADYLLGRDDPPAIGDTVQFEGKEYRTTGKWIPVLGSVPAGTPLEAIEDIIGYEEIPLDMAEKGEYIGLKIRGDSMEPKISNGDVVIVRLQDDINTGDIAIVLVNGDEATCKKIKKTPDGIMLIPTNPEYEPWFYTNEEIINKPVRILGKVVELRAKF